MFRRFQPRCLTYGNTRTITNKLFANHSSELKNNGAHVIGQSTSSLYKQHSWYSSSSRRHASFTLCNAKPNLCSLFSQSFFDHTRRNIITHPVQIARKGFSQIRFYCGPNLSPLRRNTHVKSFFSTLYRGYTTVPPLQTAWRRFLHARSYSGPSVLRLNRDAYMPSFFSILSRHNTVTHHAQIAWKRSVHLRSYSGPAFPRHKTGKHYSQFPWKRFTQSRSYSGTAVPLSNRSIRAVILALKRSHPVFYWIFGSIIGAVAWPQRASADAEDYLPIGNSLYMHAQDGHMYLVSLILSVLEGLVLFMRTMYLAVLFSPAIAMAPFADSFGIEFRRKWLHVVRVTLERAGPAFIKWGQWAATRPDLFPRDLCIELSKLHSKAPEHSFAYTKRSIEKAFGRKLLDIFDIFEERPIASGSVAQVHRATLRFRYPGKKDNPIEVAVKVRHPGVSESIRRDFVIILFFAKISNFIPALKWLRLDESVQQFAVFMMSQVDLSREAAQLSRFNYNFSKSRYVSFPRPLYPLVHPAVLVETYEKGESVSRYIDDDDELVGSDRTKRFLADVGTRALLKMLLEDNFIHADMHPGNILVRETQGTTKPHVVFLDVGMTAELSRNDQLNLREFFKSVALRDGRTAAECTLKFSKNQNCPNPEAFIEEVEKSFTFWGTEEGDIVHPAECMHQLLEQVRRHKVNIDGNVCTVMVTTLVLEGWQRKLDPDYNVMHTLQTLLFKADWVEDLVYTINSLV